MKNRLLLLAAMTLFTILQLTMGCAEERKELGEKYYELYCANCHHINGQGLANLIPPLAKSDYLLKHIEELPCIIYYGLEGEIEVNGRTFNQPMPANKELSSQQIMHISNYILNEWGNEYRKIYRQELEQWFEVCPSEK
ncbi:MAG: c-type cytochrome [Chitinophagales bacterium]